MLDVAVSFGAILVVMLVLDGVWLGWLAKGFYQRGLQRAIVFEVRWWAALCFYLLHAAGTIYFAGLVEGPGLGGVMLRAALFGLATYGTYNLTNLATVRHWPVAVALVDMAWGSCITLLAATAAYLIPSWFF